MKIQSLSIVVPGAKCVNNCHFCVSKTHESPYPNCFADRLSLHNLQLQAAYQQRLAFARDNGCNTTMLTGQLEPAQNLQFLELFGRLNRHLAAPFRIIEIQTTGVLLTPKTLAFLRDSVGVVTASLSISSFDDLENYSYTRMPSALQFKLATLTQQIKDAGINLRLSLNLTAAFGQLTPAEIFQRSRDLGADQVTLRVLYTSQNDTAQDQWIKQNKLDDRKLLNIREYIRAHGRVLETLEFGQTKYSVNSLGTVLDDDCMSLEIKEAIKYLILRENCRLYTKWDDTGSLLF